MRTTNLYATLAILTAMTLGTGCGLQEGTPPPDCGEECNPPADGGTGGPDAGNGGTDGGTGTNDGGGTTTPTTAPGPVVSPSACRLEFHDDYISGSPCGDVVGTLPGMTWTSGTYIRDTNADGRLELQMSSVPSGTYSLTYRDRECPGETPRTAWALYGDPEDLRAMSAADRQFIYCNWWDAANSRVVTAPDTNGDGLPDPGCNIRITVGNACAITGAGNMANFR